MLVSKVFIQGRAKSRTAQLVMRGELQYGAARANRQLSECCMLYSLLEETQDHLELALLARYLWYGGGRDCIV